MVELVLSVFLPDAKVASVINGLARQNGWKDEVENEEGEIIPNPVSKGQWVKTWILNVVRASWKAWNDADAQRTALDNQTEDGSDFE